MTGGVVRRDGLREKFARVLEQHWVEYVDEQCGFECGCNEHGGLHLPDRSSALAHQAEQIARVLNAEPDVPPTEALVIHVEADALDGGFVSSVVGVPGCMSQGETAREAVESVLDALDEFGGRATKDSLSATDAETAGQTGRAAVVPPDPPAADRSALGDAVLNALCDSPIWENRHIGELEVHIADGIADALLSSGVLVAVADVRASAEEAALQVVREAVNQADVRREDGLRTRDRIREAVSDYATRNVYRDMRDRAVSEREGGGSDG